MILGLTGSICAGKDEVGKILEENGFIRLSLVEEIRAEARRRGIEITRKSLQDLGDELRKTRGGSVLAKHVMTSINSSDNYVIESIRNPSEVKALQELKGFILVCVTADDMIRFERMRLRAREQDPQTFDAFLKVEARDRGIGQATHGQQNEACWRMASITLENNGTFEQLRASVTAIIDTLREVLR